MYALLSPQFSKRAFPDVSDFWRPHSCWLCGKPEKATCVCVVVGGWRGADVGGQGEEETKGREETCEAGTAEGMDGPGDRGGHY